MIQLCGVSKTFADGARESVHAVQDVSLHIDRGEIFGIIGFSGAGKSTLVRLINLLERPTEGRVFVAGRELTAMPEKELRLARRKIGMIFQLFNLMASRTVYQNIAYPLQGLGLTDAQKRGRVQSLLNLVGLEDKWNAYPRQLSGGQKQRVAIARALASDPDVLLCDEATSALDPQTTQDILRLLRDVNEKLGVTIVLITHEMAVVKEICSRVAVMDAGRVVEEGDLYDVFSAPKMEITQRFIDTTSNISKLEELLRLRPESLGISKEDVVVRFDCKENSTGQAIVSTLSRTFGLDISIIFGNVEMIRDLPLGTLVVSFRGAPDAIRNAFAYLKENDIRVEVITHA